MKFGDLAVHVKHTSALFSMQIEYYILTRITGIVLDPMPAMSAYSAIFPPPSAAI